MYEWLYGSLILLLIWIILFLSRKEIRKEMLIVSLFTMPLGLTEPLFVPKYWNPGTLFNLAQKTGFDIESLIFCFAIGGIATVFYEALFKTKHIKMSLHGQHKKRHNFHRLALLSPFIAFLILFPFVKFNVIYTAILVMFIGGFATTLCRPDLIKKMIYTGLLFLLLYFILFLILNIASPNYTIHTWNLDVLSGILILGVPLEELLFALGFGTLWGSWYEHYNMYKLA